MLPHYHPFSLTLHISTGVLRLALAVCGSLARVAVHLVAVAWLAVDGRGYLRAAPWLHPRLTAGLAAAAVACHASGLTPVQFQVQAISHGVLLILQQVGRGGVG